jgi:hypothetical protein
MQLVRNSRHLPPAPAAARAGLVSRAAKLALGTALVAVLSGVGWVQPAAAQEDTIVLTAGGATLTVSPGHASAVSAVAEAHASPGHAETIAAAARAVADCVDGALTEGAAALAVAHPDQGALTQSAATEIIARNNNDDSPFRKAVENRCEQEKKEEKKAPPAPKPEPAPAPEPAPEPVPEVVVVPTTGVGLVGSAGLSSFFAAAAMAAAAGAVAFRNRGVQIPGGVPVADRTSGPGW